MGIAGSKEVKSNERRRTIVHETRTDVLVVGGGLGGVAAALAVARHGHSVLITESTDWLGGQLTTQAVPLDEHPWIEMFGCTQSYRRLRDAIRTYYRDWYPLTDAARSARFLNPGAGLVSKLCIEPKVAVSVIESLMAPYVSSGLVRILRRHVAVSADIDHDEVKCVVLRDTKTGLETSVVADFFLDATETGDLLPLTGTEYVVGAESQRDTGEPHAPLEAQPGNMQAISVCFAIDHLAGENHVIDRPIDYEKWRCATYPAWPGKLLSWTSPHPITKEPVTRTFNPNPDGDPLALIADQGASMGDDELWLFRRIAARLNFRPGSYSSDICLVNWPMIDYFETPLIDGDPKAQQAAINGAKQLSLSVLYWMQTEAPRQDGGVGFPGLRLRADVVDTVDGLAKAPYIRESRRILAKKTVVEQDLSYAVRGDAGAVAYRDTVGIGCYRIDLHPSTGGDNYINVPASPFQIPLGSLIPLRVRNLLPAAKNIGTTHITNGCYRLHPVEWNIGEVAGLLASACIDGKALPIQVLERHDLLDRFQRSLTKEGIELAWPDIRAYGRL